MAQKKRYKKRSGTQSGSVAKKRGSNSRSRVVDKRDLPPTWTGAIGRALFAALLFFLLMFLLFDSPLGNAALLAVIMFGIYVFISYQMDSVMYRRRQRQKALAKANHAAANQRRK